jgi:hypothetical protein
MEASLVSAILFSDKNIPVSFDGVYSNYGNSHAKAAKGGYLDDPRFCREFKVNSSQTIVLDQYLSVFEPLKSTKDQSLKNFEDKGGRLVVSFSGSPVFLGSDKWILSNLELQLNFKDQFGNVISKNIPFANINPSKPLTNFTSADPLAAAWESQKIVCSFDKNFNPVSYTLTDLNYKTTTYNY